MPAKKKIDAATFQELFDEIRGNVETVVKGKSDIVRLALVAMLAEGHVLFEDVPGTGKSVLARALSQSLDADVRRVQCTPDMLPAEITGSSVYDQKTGEFTFQPGPVFTTILLADEINRATPKTQSALLEAMAERRVSVDGVTRPLPRPFFVLATQNPVEQAGTFPLPEAQLDRFLFRLSMGYMEIDVEIEVMLANASELAIDSLEAVTTLDTVQRMIGYAQDAVEVSPGVARYIVQIVNATRSEPALALGASARASVAVLKAAKVLAASDGRTHVYPDDVRLAAEPALNHRLIMNPEHVLRGETVSGVLDRILATIKPPSAASLPGGGSTMPLAGSLT